MFSAGIFWDDVIAFIHRNLVKGDNILDVGAGDGKLATLLNGKYAIDAVEIWEPYVAEHDLDKKYGQVYVEDIRDFAGACQKHYDLVFMGDIMEHISGIEAIEVLNRLRQISHLTLIVVPFENHAVVATGNTHQTHIQDDLNPSVMKNRYPNLACLGIKTVGRDWQGLYLQTGTRF